MNAKKQISYPLHELIGNKQRNNDFKDKYYFNKIDAFNIMI